MTTISVITGAAGLKRNAMLSSLSRIWEERGIRLSIGAAVDPAARLAFLHVDRTVIDPSELAAVPQGMRVINGKVLDISKRRHSVLALTEQSDWDGPVILKTNLNCFGRPERSELPLLRQVAPILHRRLASVSWRLARALPDKTYPVLRSIRDVPEWVWRDEDLLVERFMPEREGQNYVLRIWMFFGSRHYGVRMVARDPLVKVRTRVYHEFTTDVPDELHELRAQHGFDYGKFDYVMHDGKPLLLDLNRTPTVASQKRSPRTELLAGAIDEFL